MLGRLLAFLTLGSLMIVLIVTFIRRWKVDSFQIFSFLYLFTIVVPSLHVVIFPEIFLSQYDQPMISNPLTVSLIFAAFYLIIFISYRSIPRLSNNLDLKTDITYYYYITILCLLISVASILVYIHQFDSAIVPFRDAALIRSNVISAEGNLVFVKSLIPISFIGLLLCYGLYSYTGAVNKTMIIVLIFLVVCTAATILLASRRVVIDIFLMILFIEIARGKLSLKGMIIITVSSILIIYFSNAVFSSLYGGFDVFFNQLVSLSLFELYISIISNFTYNYVSIEVTLENRKLWYRGIIDYLQSPLQLIPQQATGIEKPPRLADLHTHAFRGRSTSTTLPPGGISQAIYSGGMFGLVIYATFSGLVLKMIDQTIEIEHFDRMSLVVYILIYYTIVEFVLTSPEMFITSRITNMMVILFFILALVWVSKGVKIRS